MASMLFTDYSSSTRALLQVRCHKYSRCSTNGLQYSHWVSVSVPSPPLFLPCLSFKAPSCSSPLVSAKMSTDANSAKVIDGKSMAKQIRKEIADEVSRMKDDIGSVPGLAVILVGDDINSLYIGNEIKACMSVGISLCERRFPENCSEEKVIDCITRFNEDPTIHGILVQLPLPSVLMKKEKILNAIKIEKDVSGFHPLNMAHLAMRGGEPLFVPYAAKACIELLHRSGIHIKGKRAVVIGDNNIIGMPLAFLLQREDATVTIVHYRTMNPEEITKQADIIISNFGRPNMVKGSWIKPGAVVIDVLVTRIEYAENGKRQRVIGDVCYEEAAEVASAIAPVSIGVGPMTTAMLLLNTLISAKRILNFQ